MKQKRFKQAPPARNAKAQRRKDAKELDRLLRLQRADKRRRGK